MKAVKRGLFWLVATWGLLPCAGITQATIDYDDFQSQPKFQPDKELLLKLVNDLRQEGCICGKQVFPPVGRLKWDTILEKTAYEHGVDLFENQYFSHTGLDGSQPWDRAARNNYPNSFVGENIARGYESEEEVILGWKNSPGHCANMMRGDFDLMATSCADEWHWVQLFGVSDISRVEIGQTKKEYRAELRRKKKFMAKKTKSLRRERKIQNKARVKNKIFPFNLIN